MFRKNSLKSANAHRKNYRVLNLTVLMIFLVSMVMPYGVNVSAATTLSLNETFDNSPFVPGYNLPTTATIWHSLSGGAEDSTVAEASGGNSIKLTTVTTTASTTSNIRLTSPTLSLAAPSSGLVVLETMLKYGPNSIQSIANIGITYTNASKTYTNNVGFRLNGGLNNTYFKATNGKASNVVGNINSTLTYNTDQWYAFKIIMNPSTSMYDVYIDGTKQNASPMQMTWYSTALAASNPYIGSTVTSVTANLYSSYNLASNYMNVDNVKLYQYDGNIPIADKVQVSGSTGIGETLSGTYNFSSYKGNVELGTTCKWLRADSADSTQWEEICTGTTISVNGSSYTLTEADMDKYIKLSIVPKDSLGNTGDEVISNIIKGPSKPVASNAVLAGISNISYTITGSYQ